MILFSSFFFISWNLHFNNSYFVFYSSSLSSSLLCNIDWIELDFGFMFRCCCFLSYIYFHHWFSPYYINTTYVYMFRINRMNMLMLMLMLILILLSSSSRRVVSYFCFVHRWYNTSLSFSPSSQNKNEKTNSSLDNTSKTTTIVSLWIEINRCMCTSRHIAFLFSFFYSYLFV